MRFFVAALIAIQTCIIMLSGAASAAPARFTPAADDASAEAPPPIMGTYRPGGVIETARWYVAEAHQPKAHLAKARRFETRRSEARPSQAHRPETRPSQAQWPEARQSQTHWSGTRQSHAHWHGTRPAQNHWHLTRQAQDHWHGTRPSQTRRFETRQSRARASEALLSRAMPRHAVRVSHAFATDQLALAGLTWKSSGHCADRHNSVCTSMQAIRSETLVGVIDLKRESGCPVVVTGGTEAGHAPGAFSHAAGYKIDIRHNKCVDRHITKKYPRAGVRSDGSALYRSASGDIFASESDHWDILFR
ncbi:hypothetical protein GCM10010404_33280 [Nonomuraea africana]